MSLDLPDEARSVPLCRGAVRAVLRDLAVEPERAFDIELVVSEATANVIRHAYGNPGNRYLVTVEIFADRVRLQVEDHGRGFERAAVPEPEVEEASGRGLWLIEQLSNVATVRTLANGGCLVEAELSFSHPLEFTPDPGSPD
jgi:anti-sigma regulatory factor (Ser/Thr protein kinase)